jgi:hypothetical protein
VEYNRSEDMGIPDEVERLDDTVQVLTGQRGSFRWRLVYQWNRKRMLLAWAALQEALSMGQPDSN